MYGKKTLSLLIVFMMIVVPSTTILTSDSNNSATAEIVLSTDNSQNEYTFDDFFIYDEESGTLMMNPSILGGVFGNAAVDEKPLDATNPIPNEYNVAPLEIAMWHGGDNSYYDIYENQIYLPDKPISGIIYSTKGDGNTDSNHGISFAAALSKNSEVYKGVTAARDWICTLFYDDNSGHLKLNVLKTDDDYHELDIDSLGISSGYSAADVNLVSTLQSKNILNYAVGDFDGDGNEEIAVLHQSYIMYFGLNLTTGALELLYYTDIFTDSGSLNYLYSPVSMYAGDVDGDGSDELLVCRGYYSDGIPGKNEYTMMGFIDIGCSDFKSESKDNLFHFSLDSDYCQWLHIVLKDPSSGETLESVMTSAVFADINRDGHREIVVGGYLWDNDNTSTSYNEDPSHAAGELYLAYAKYDREAGKIADGLNNLTILMDDNSTAATWNGSLAVDSTYTLSSKNDEIEGHNKNDTSIFLEDWNDNPLLLCRSLNWSNWTIPMNTVSLSGFQNGNFNEQVFFDIWVYDFNTTTQSFYVYKAINGTLYTYVNFADDNNIMCNAMCVGALASQDLSNYYDNHQDLLIHFGIDTEENSGLSQGGPDGETIWYYGVLCRDIVFNSTSISRPMSFPQYGDIRDWGNGLYNVGKVAFGNFDDDSYTLTPLRHYFRYIDPVVNVFLSGVPCESDMAELLAIGTSSIGETSIINSQGSSSGSGTAFEGEGKISFEAGGIGGFFNISAGAGYWGEDNVTNTHTVELTSTFATSTDSVLLFTVPVDVYVYYVTDLDKNSYVTEVPIARDPVYQAMEYERYVEYIGEYNDWMKMMYNFCEEEGYTPLEVINPEHVEGDISTYVHQNTGNDIFDPIDVYYFGDGDGSSFEFELTIEDENESEHIDGGVEELSLGFDLFEKGASIGGYTTKGSFGISPSAEFHEGTISLTADSSGMGFSSKLNQGFREYLKDASESYKESIGQYWMKGTFWASTRSSATDDYYYVGYTVDSYGVGAKFADLTYYPFDVNNSDSKYNPTADTACFTIRIDNSLDDGAIKASNYYVEYKYQDLWYKIGEQKIQDHNFPQIKLYEEADDVWVESDNQFIPAGSDEYTTFNIAISGLSSVLSDSMDFRIVGNKFLGYTDTTNSSSAVPIYAANPALPVTAYKDYVTNSAAVIYHNNTGAEEDISFEATAFGKTVVLPEDCFFDVPIDFSFIGWSTSADGTEMVETITVDEVCEDIYAVWSSNVTFPSTDALLSSISSGVRCPLAVVDCNADGVIESKVFSALANCDKDLKVLFRDENGTPLLRLLVYNIDNSVLHSSLEIPSVMLEYNLPSEYQLLSSGNNGIVCIHLSNEFVTTYDIDIKIYTDLVPGSTADVYIFNESTSDLWNVAENVIVGADGQISFMYKSPEKEPADSNGALALICIVMALIVTAFFFRSLFKK